jgi:hypothetical protein
MAGPFAGTRCGARPALLLSLCLFAGLACSGDDDDPAPAPDASFQALFDAAGDFADPEERADVVATEGSTVLVGNENWTCTTRTYDVVRAPDEFPLFDPNSEVIWPGNLLQGASLGQATPAPIPARRGPGTVVLTLVNGASEGVSRAVPELSMYAVYDALNDIVARAPETIPARFTFTMERVDSEEQLALAAHASASGWGASVKAALSFSTDRAYNRFLVKLSQSFFTAAVEPPASFGAMFAPGVTPEQLAEHVGPGNPAAYISSVTYGRIFYLLFESTERVEKISASLDASFSGWGVEVEAGAGANHVGSLENLRVKAFALGGDAGAAISAITNDLDTLKEFLAEGGTIDTGVPISYVVRSVRHPEKVVRVALATTYDVTDCVPVYETFGEPIVWLDASTLGAVDPVSGERVAPASGAAIRLWPDRSGAANDAYEAVTLLTAPAYRRAAVNGLMPAVEFTGDAKLRFFGGGFARSDYTLTAVAAFSGGGGGLHFLDGSTGSPGRVVRAGFRTPGAGEPASFGVDHGGGGVFAPHVGVAGAFHVYTLVFSRTAGMTLFIDGVPVASAPAAIEPVLDFFGAHVGMLDVVPNASVTVAELMAHRVALTPAQRLYVEDNLMRKYRF